MDYLPSQNEQTFKPESPVEVKYIKVEEMQDSELSEYDVAGSSQKIELAKDEIKVDDEDNTSQYNEDIYQQESDVQKTHYGGKF